MGTPFDNTKVCVILPAHNEAELIGGVIRSLPEWVTSVVVVDDVSTDDTCAVVEALADPRVTLVRHSENTGVGGAMVTGYKKALELDCDILVKMDADGQMAPSDLPRLVRPLVDGHAEYAKGNRFYVVNANRGMPRTRKFGSVVLTFMTKMSSGYWHIFDSQCGFTAMRTHLLKMIDLDAVAKDYFFENDMLIWLNTADARVVDVPIKTLYGDEVSDVRISKVMWSFPPRLLRGWFFRVGRKYLLMDFGAIGALGLFGTALTAFGAIFGTYWLVRSNVTGVATTTGTVMFAVLPLIVGIQCLLQSFVMEVQESPGAEETRHYIHDLIDSGDVD
jgi:glycosyltransferase involved in cell wall biosynthesis